MASHFSLQSAQLLRLFLILLVLIFCTCCMRYPQAETNGAYNPTAVTFDTSQVHIVTNEDTFALQVELAVSRNQLAYGLMDRSQLPGENGMLFLFKETQPADAGFWMFRTRIPLDIAYINDAGEIVSIQAMDPCKSPNPKDCNTYTPGRKYSAALEVNHGFFVSRKVVVGDRILIPALGIVSG